MTFPRVRDVIKGTRGIFEIVTAKTFAVLGKSPLLKRVTWLAWSEQQAKLLILVRFSSARSLPSLVERERS